MRFPPAWYPDPTGRHDHRWWDGEAWTQHVADAGAASTDPLPEAPTATAPAAAVGGTPPSTSAAAVTGRATPGIAVAALVVGISTLVLGWVPVLGVLVGLVAVVLAAVAIRRTTTGRGRGLATIGLVGGSLGLLAGIATTWIAALLLADGAGGAIGRALRDHADCLETRPAEVCERELTSDLLDALGR